MRRYADLAGSRALDCPAPRSSRFLIVRLFDAVA
jgi:hypothetical protein